MSYKYKGDYEKNIVFGADITSKEQVTQYLSVLYESDRAFEELIQYFQRKDEKTIILMFGDIDKPSSGGEEHVVNRIR